MKPNSIWIKISVFAFFLASFCNSSAFSKEVTINSDGFIYRAEYQITEDADKNNPTFLIVHGTLAHNQMEIVQQMSELLHENGYNTLAINLSLGISNRESDFYDCANFQYHSHYDAIEEIKLWVQWLEKQGVEKIVLVGHSRGGNQASLYLQNAQKSVTQAVLIAPATWDFKAVQEAYDKNGENLNKLLEKSKSRIAKNKAEESFSAPFIYCESAIVSAETFYDYYKDDPFKNTPYAISKLPIPILVIAGSKDKIVKDLPEMMKKHVTSNPNIQFEVIQGSDHFFRDLNMDDVVDLVMDFIEQ